MGRESLAVSLAWGGCSDESSGGKETMIDTGADPGISGGPADEEGTNNVTINIGAINDAPVVGAPVGRGFVGTVGWTVGGTVGTVTGVGSPGANMSRSASHSVPSDRDGSRTRAAVLLASRCNAEGELVLQVSDTRSQRMNREIAIGRAADLVGRAGAKPKRRRPTRR